jgi:hypothetical protein
MTSEERLTAFKRLATITSEKAKLQRRMVLGDELCSQDWYRLEAERLHLRRQLGQDAPAD